MKKLTGILFLSTLVLAACSAPAPQPTEAAAPLAPVDSQVTELAPEPLETGYVELSVQEAQDLMAVTPDLVIVDVSPAYAAGHLPGAISLPLSQLEGRLNELDPSRPHLVYCHGDGPAIQGAEILVNNGFLTVYRLLGNYQGWVEAGLPVEQ